MKPLAARQHWGGKQVCFPPQLEPSDFRCRNRPTTTPPPHHPKAPLTTPPEPTALTQAHSEEAWNASVAASVIASTTTEGPDSGPRQSRHLLASDFSSFCF